MFNKKIVSFDLGNTVDCDISQALLDKIKRVREGKEPFSDEIADEIKKIGFNVEPLSEESPFLRYGREGQHLARDVWKFVKK